MDATVRRVEPAQALETTVIARITFDAVPVAATICVPDDYRRTTPLVEAVNAVRLEKGEERNALAAVNHDPRSHNQRVAQLEALVQELIHRQSGAVK